MSKNKYFTFKKNENFVSLKEFMKEAPIGEEDNTSERAKDEKENIKNLEIKDGSGEDVVKEILGYSRLTSIILMILSAIGVFAVSCLLFKYAKNYLFYSKMIIMYIIVTFVAITDYKRHIIPNLFIIIGLISRAVIYVLEFIFCRDIFTSILKNDAVGFVLGFVILFIVAMIARNSLGFGDVKLYGIIGLLSGGTCTYCTLILSLLCCAIISIILMCIKKKNKNSQISLAPFIYIGFTVCCVLGIF
ncbi:MAG: prepilin peptidase [Hominimerdicola sp.]